MEIIAVPMKVFSMFRKAPRWPAMSGGGLEKESTASEHKNMKFEIKLKRKGNLWPCHYLAKLLNTFAEAIEL